MKRQKSVTARRIIFAFTLPMAAMFLTAAINVPAAAQKQVPFRGSLQGRETDVVQPPATLLVDGNGTGIATHLGQFTVTWEATVNLENNSGIGSYHFIAANGDSIFAAVVGQAELVEPPDVFNVVEINTITGGTGRFAGAKGSFTVERLVNLTTGFTSGSFHGTLPWAQANPETESVSKVLFGRLDRKPWHKSSRPRDNG